MKRALYLEKLFGSSEGHDGRLLEPATKGLSYDIKAEATNRHTINKLQSLNP